ncbi:MAG: hypothetical protein U0T59_01030 [Buchnera aphidicola (Meitanaphis flavogallis)]
MLFVGILRANIFPDLSLIVPLEFVSTCILDDLKSLSLISCLVLNNCNIVILSKIMMIEIVIILSSVISR